MKREAQGATKAKRMMYYASFSRQRKLYEEQES